MKKIIYTCVTSQFDELKDPISPCSDCEYICFSDSYFNSKIWKFKPLLKSFNCPRLTARYHKTIGANKIDADITIWQDGKIQLLKNHTHLFKKGFFVRKHPKRICAYEEAMQVIRLRKCSHALVKSQMRRYRMEGFPLFFGLYETSILIRDKTLSDFNEIWWEEIKNNSIRDQISLPYVLWKLSIVPEELHELAFLVQEHSFMDYYERIKLL